MKLNRFLTATFLLSFASVEVLAAKYSLTPEQAAALLETSSKSLSDDEWKNIAGAQFTEKYSVVNGDTLSDISHRLFGDQKYWPKIWSLNSGKIHNPHKIFPGDVIAFASGTSSSLPSVGITSASADDVEGSNSTSITTSKSSERSTELKTGRASSDAPPQPKRNRSKEWQMLPKQKWEIFKPETSPEIDPLGFDRRNKINFHGPTGFETVAVPASEKITLLGQITGSQSDASNLDMYDTVYIRADETIQPGMTYAVTDGPSPLVVKNKEKDIEKTGYAYNVIGKVKILTARDNVFVGQILSARDFIPRGSFIMPLPQRIPVLQPTPGGSAVEATLLIDHHFSTFTTAQHKEVFVDKGSQDGIKPGMIFRAYEHFDPSNDKEITKSDFIIDADLMVTQVSEAFSSAIIINSRVPIKEFAKVVLLTDVSDLIKNIGVITKSTNDDLEDLDKLDHGEGLGKNDQRTLKQLEKWKGNPEGQGDVAGKSGSGDLPPPPDGNAPPTPLPGSAQAGGENAPPPPGADQGTGPSPASAGGPPPPSETPGSNAGANNSNPNGGEDLPPPLDADGGTPPASDQKAAGNASPPNPANSASSPPPTAPSASGSASPPAPPGMAPIPFGNPASAAGGGGARKPGGELLPPPSESDPKLSLEPPPSGSVTE